MTWSPRIAVLFSAVDVAMQAKSGTLEAADVHALQSRAEQELGRDDPAFYAINAFATQYELILFDVERQADLGRTLHDAIERAMRPDPVDAGRRDIHG